MLPGGVEVPERLRVCIVEDWTAAGDPHPCWHDGCADPQCVEVAAHVRWEKARSAFAAEHRVTWKDSPADWFALCAMTTGGRPRWRDRTDPRLVEGVRWTGAHPRPTTEQEE